MNSGVFEVRNMGLVACDPAREGPIDSIGLVLADAKPGRWRWSVECHGDDRRMVLSFAGRVGRTSRRLVCEVVCESGQIAALDVATLAECDPNVARAALSLSDVAPSLLGAHSDGWRLGRMQAWVDRDDGDHATVSLTLDEARP